AAPTTVAARRPSAHAAPERPRPDGAGRAGGGPRAIRIGVARPPHRRPVPPAGVRATLPPAARERALPVVAAARAERGPERCRLRRQDRALLTTDDRSVTEVIRPIRRLSFSPDLLRPSVAHWP